MDPILISILGGQDFCIISSNFIFIPFLAGFFYLPPLNKDIKRGLGIIHADFVCKVRAAPCFTTRYELVLIGLLR
jgi:hypothetical protein